MSQTVTAAMAMAGDAVLEDLYAAHPEWDEPKHVVEHFDSAAVFRAMCAAQEPSAAQYQPIDIETIRHGLSEALVLCDLANHQGDTPPFTSGYDDVHDAYNAVWLAARAFNRIFPASPSTVKERT